MKREEHFSWVTDQETGNTGWLMLRMRHFDPVRGFGMAHDMLEHFDTQVGLEAECMAFGAMMWIRGDGLLWDRINAESKSRATHAQQCEGIGYDLYDLLKNEGFKVAACDWPAPMLEDYQAEWLSAMLKGLQLAADAEDDEDVVMQDYFDHLPRVADWIRAGYTRCEGHWNCRPDTLATVFYDLEKYIDALSESREEGNEIHVRINDDLTWAVEVTIGVDENGNYVNNDEPPEEDEEA